MDAEGKRVIIWTCTAPNGCDMSALDMPRIFDDCLCLIEWPERLSKDSFPKEYLLLTWCQRRVKVINESCRRHKVINWRYYSRVRPNLL